jgi:hypothetical protein
MEMALQDTSKVIVSDSNKTLYILSKGTPRCTSTCLQDFPASGLKSTHPWIFENFHRSPQSCFSTRKPLRLVHLISAIKKLLNLMVYGNEFEPDAADTPRHKHKTGINIAQTNSRSPTARTRSPISPSKTCSLLVHNSLQRIPQKRPRLVSF